jgi:hypothetical protein
LSSRDHTSNAVIHSLQRKEAFTFQAMCKKKRPGSYPAFYFIR